MECPVAGRFKRPATRPLPTSTTSDQFIVKKRRAANAARDQGESIASAPSATGRAECSNYGEVAEEDLSVSSIRLWPKSSAPTVLQSASVNDASFSSAPSNLDDDPHALSCNSYRSYSSPVSSLTQHKPSDPLLSPDSRSGAPADEWRPAGEQPFADGRTREPSIEGEAEESSCISGDERDDGKGDFNRDCGAAGDPETFTAYENGDEDQNFPVKLLLEEDASDGASCSDQRPPDIVGYYEPMADSILDNGWPRSPAASPAPEEEGSLHTGGSPLGKGIPSVLHRLHRLQRELLVDWNRHSKEVELFQRGMCSLFHSRDRVLHRLHAVLHETQHLIESQRTTSVGRNTSMRPAAYREWDNALISPSFQQAQSNPDVWYIPQAEAPSTAIPEMNSRTAYPSSPLQKTEAWLSPPPYLTPENAQFKHNVSSSFHSPWQNEQTDPARSFQNAWDTEGPISPSERQLWPVNPKLKEDIVPPDAREKSSLVAEKDTADDERWYNDDIGTFESRHKGDSNDEQSISLCSNGAPGVAHTEPDPSPERVEEDEEDEEEEDDEEEDGTEYRIIKSSSCQPRQMSIARKLSSPKGHSVPISWSQAKWIPHDTWPEEGGNSGAGEGSAADEEEGNDEF